MQSNINKLSQYQKILTAAFKCISSKGYANVSLRDIASEAGVVLSQLNYYFKNKEGLFIEVVKIAIKDYITDIEKCIKKESASKIQLNYLISSSQKILKKKPETFRLLIDFTSLALWSESFSFLIKNLFKDLSELIEKNILVNFSLNNKNYSSKEISRMLFGALFGTSIQALIENNDQNLITSMDSIQMLLD
jgi:AcrR family transcriptional regulator